MMVNWYASSSSVAEGCLFDESAVVKPWIQLLMVKICLYFGLMILQPENKVNLGGGE